MPDLERTTDPEVIRSVFARAEVFPFVVTGGHPATWQPQFNEGIHWLAAPGAVFLTYPSSGVLWEMHAASVAKGKTAEYARQFFDYLRDNTNCRHVIAVITETNLKAIKRAESVGMRLEGIFPDSRIVNEQLVGALVYGKGI